jgi:DNA-binding transcriptional LysR family regulator
MVNHMFRGHTEAMTSVSRPAVSRDTPPVTVAQLTTFLAVAESGSVRAAAARLVVSESAVSAAVGALGRHLGVALLSRQGRGVCLAAAGAGFAPYARQVLGLLTEGAAAARAGADPSRGSVRIAAVTTAAEQLLPALLAAFRSEHPDVEVHLQVADSRSVWAAFDAHEVEVVLAGRPPSSLGDALTRGLRYNRLITVGAPGSGADPGASTWLMREAGSGTRATLESLLQARDLHPPLLHMGSSGAVIAGAIAGLGLGLVAHDAVRDHLRSGALEEVAVFAEPLLRPWHLVTHQDYPATGQLFVGFLLAEPRFAFRRP